MKKKIAVILMDAASLMDQRLTKSLTLELEKTILITNALHPISTYRYQSSHTRRIQQTRNILTESARIVRGNIQNLTELNASNFSGLIVTGGLVWLKTYQTCH